MSINGDVMTNAAKFNQAVASLDPGKDSNGKTNSGVRYATTKNTFDSSVTPSFLAFQASINTMISAMGKDSTAAGCDDVFAQAEFIVDGYVKARDNYLKLVGRIKATQVAEYEQTLQDYSPFMLTVTESAAGSSTTAAPEVFNFDPLFSLVTSSAGFMVTELPSRSYTSGTAPDPTAPTTSTQNVLVVSDSSGVRPTLDALLNVNVPWLNKQNIGTGISVGLVYDISNGKADTSNFGLFGGISVRLTDYLYLTPGWHLGQFADFPQGFTHSGQVIPPNTGTPTPVKRYTARFGFSITFRLKDLYSPKTNTNSAATPQSTGNQAPTAQTPNATAKKAKP